MHTAWNRSLADGEKQTMISVQKYPLSLVGIWFLGILAILTRLLQLTDGHLIYSLDDPYIHLAVAENILRGGYGVNLSEPSSPSSSLLYPFLLAFTEWIHLGEWGPLVLNLIAMASSVYVVGRILNDHVWSQKALAGRPLPSSYFRFGIGLLCCLAMNAWGLPYAGMEHSLHVLATLIVFQGFLDAIADNPEKDFWPRWSCLAALIALPLIRFEGMALALIAIILFFYLKQWRPACIAILAIGLAFGCWYGFTKSMGLPAIPSSVQVKSDIAASVGDHRGASQFVASLLDTIELHVRVTFMNPFGVRLAFALLLAGYLLCLRWRANEKKAAFLLGSLVLGVGVAHVFFGKFGIGGRYEPYALILATLYCVISLRHHFQKRKWQIGAAAVLLLLGEPYLTIARVTPIAALNIYQQQYQMHRFAVEYWKKPIAVNDLGWVSYRNPEYVLDLWGLGSEDARHILGTETTRARRMLRGEGGSQASELANLVDRKGVTLILIYDKWFARQIPTQWQKVATLVTPQVSAADPEVSFYITHFADRDAVLALLRQFAPTLPRDTKLKIDERNSDAFYFRNVD